MKYPVLQLKTARNIGIPKEKQLGIPICRGTHLYTGDNGIKYSYTPLETLEGGETGKQGNQEIEEEKMRSSRLSWKNVDYKEASKNRSPNEHLSGTLPNLQFLSNFG